MKLTDHPPTPATCRCVCLANHPDYLPITGRPLCTTLAEVSPGVCRACADVNTPDSTSSGGSDE